MDDKPAGARPFKTTCAVEQAELVQFRKLCELDALLPTLAGALDLREVLGQVSSIARKVLPHDLLVIGLTEGDDEAELAIYAATPAHPTGSPPRLPLSQVSFPPEPWEYQIVPDIQTWDSALARRLNKVDPEGRWHSMLRLPIRQRGKLIGMVAFRSFQVDIYGPDDVLVASRIRDHILLAVSHSRLSEEALRLAEARERTVVLEQRVARLSDEVASLGGYGRVVCQSASWRHTLNEAARVARTDTTVLICGESGTGKEVLARFIHRESPRRNGPLVAINCAALPDTLLESELFGYEKGAFTGAVQTKPGLMEQAARGVLFLDEVGEIPHTLQAKMLRVLQEREFMRVGGTRAIPLDVRLVCATNRDLKEAIASGSFREDLYYRLAVFEIRTAPLRERPDDIIPMAEVFLSDIAQLLRCTPAVLTPEARDRLLKYAFPGNVRELRNVLERATIMCERGTIQDSDLVLNGRVTVRPAVPPAVAPLVQTGTNDLFTLERATIERVLQECRFNKSVAAKRLGITRSQMYQRLKKYGL